MDTLDLTHFEVLYYSENRQKMSSESIFFTMSRGCFHFSKIYCNSLETEVPPMHRQLLISSKESYWSQCPWMKSRGKKNSHKFCQHSLLVYGLDFEYWHRSNSLNGKILRNKKIRFLFITLWDGIKFQWKTMNYGQYMFRINI